jgi:hypothetical protein
LDLGVLTNSVGKKGKSVAGSVEIELCCGITEVMACRSTACEGIWEIPGNIDPRVPDRGEF